ncbi:MAG TPA: DUF4168 domain-containing protein [Acetobacteraceae bacterium]|jgi:hypothetical protein|nr:DUF4168 domain-containing protein [Acetobacteraceae bacterium]
MKASRVAATAAALLMASAALPAIAQQTPGVTSQQSPGVTSQQGQMSDAMVHKVGVALRHVAMIRQQYSQRAQSMAPQQQGTLDDQAKNEMVKAIGDQGLSVQQYQQAIQMAQADPSLKQRLLSVAQSGN